jgi:ADP-heptose:LPS heptosyltransferase
VLWKSLKMNASRSRFFSPFEQWRQVLDTPGVTFVNLQYGDCADELARAKAEFGIDIVQPEGIDLKAHLDDLAALCAALDLTIGPATATTNIAAAAGANTWFISTPDAWPRLGTNFYPWYTQVRVFSPTASYNWSEVMGRVATALAETFPAR